ncbi:MAG: hypothetical protein U0Q16_31505 [Bryobacteraceae bacterium]
MSAENNAGRPGVRQLFGQIRQQLVPLNSRVCYFAAARPLTEEDVRDYVEDPVAALPPSMLEQLPKVVLLLVPYIERGNGKTSGKANGHAAPPKEDLVCQDAPDESRALRSVQWMDGDEAVIALAIEEMEVADYHYELYQQLAWRLAENVASESFESYFAMLREELSNRMHGEVDEESWQRKQSLLRRGAGRRDSKAFREYAKSSLVDTLTLYLHGICCDIDVEPGPRQLPSRNLRRRLKLLQGLFPQPKGYAVFPEELDHLEAAK